MQTRREFLMTSAMCVLVAGGASVEQRLETPQIAYLEGDPYTAHADECGLGGRSFDEVREHALRFRTPAFDRDRIALGLEL